jgi:hypothetical protein
MSTSPLAPIERQAAAKRAVLENLDMENCELRKNRETPYKS